jgi:phasin family protein
MAKGETPKFELPKFEGPFFLVDMLKSFEFGKMLGEFKIPGLDADRIIQAQKKNLEALMQANKLAAEGLQAVTMRQAEIVRNTMEGFAGALRETVSGGTDPQAIAQRQAEFVKGQFEQAIGNMRELAEMTTKANSEVVELLNKRFKEAMDEIKGAAGK